MEELKRDLALDVQACVPQLHSEHAAVDGFDKARAKRIVRAVEACDNVAGKLGEGIARIDKSHWAGECMSARPRFIILLSLTGSGPRGSRQWSQGPVSGVRDHSPSHTDTNSRSSRMIPNLQCYRGRVTAGL